MCNPFTKHGLVVLTLIALLQGCAAGGGQTAGTRVPQEANRQTPPVVASANARAFEEAIEALRAGRLSEAEGLLLRITTDQPELAGPWINLAEIYAAQGLEHEARDALSRAVAANPDNCAARTELGVLLRRDGDFAAAEAQYRACLEASPDYRDAYLNLGILYELYLGRLEDALEAYRRYQLLAAEPDRRVTGWVMDLERRLGV